MSTLSYTLTDSATMLRRNLRHMLRYPAVTVMVVGMPIVFLLIFVYVFGGTLGNGLGGAAGGIAAGGRQAYLDYLVPGVLLMTLAGVAQGTALSVAIDMNEGIMARFRTMAIARSSVLTGHVLGSLIQALLCVAVVLGVGIALGFRPSAGPVDWLAATGLVLLMSFGLTWLTVCLGLVAKSVETASNTPMLLLLLPFLGSGFVPTDSMPTGLRWFAEYQPFTPMTEALRGLLTGTPLGNSVALTIGWSLAIAGLSYLWSRRLYRRAAAR